MSAATVAVIGDTHGTDGHRLEGRPLEAVRAADAVVHTGDFTTEAVLDALRDVTDRLEAVVGNNDGPALRECLPDRRVFEALGRRFVVVHGHEHTDTAVRLLGRQEGADVVVVGHSHRPGVERADGVTLLNPGSYAEPRWYRPSYAVLEREGDRVVGRLLEPDGTVIDRFGVPARRE